MRRSVRVLGVALFLSTCVIILIWYAALAEDHRGRLTVAFLSGGEIFVVTPGGRQVLIDGGQSVARELGSVMPLYDRSIDMVIARSPDPAKTSGLIDILNRYAVGTVGESAARSDAPQEASFAATIAAKEASGMHVREFSRGDAVDFGDGAYLETLFPDRDAASMTATDGCLILKIVYGRTSFLISCASPAIESYLAMLDGTDLKADVVFALRDSSPLFIGFAQPQFAVDADPCDAPAPETSVFARFSVLAVSACTAPVVFASDTRTVVKER